MTHLGRKTCWLILETPCSWNTSPITHCKINLCGSFAIKKEIPVYLVVNTIETLLCELVNISVIIVIISDYFKIFWIVSGLETISDEFCSSIQEF